MSRAASLRPRVPSHAFAALHPTHRIPRRTFLGYAPKVITERRTLPYDAARLFDLIADIDSYASFLPYCSASRVTRWTDPDGAGRRWPARADLTVGWAGVTRLTYTSRVFCVAPGPHGGGAGVVEAVSGDARSALPASARAAYNCLPDDDYHHDGNGDESSVFKSMSTQWIVAPAPPAARADRSQRPAWSDVTMRLEFAFKNPLYHAISEAAADKVAPMMIKAFVERAEAVLGDPQTLAENRKGDYGAGR
ncbi:dehydrase and lipid transport-domain-containing protein [Xylariomycetidae sp. FL0641]|nr:dehydrase and lipid transport-domain-containing protein [Xylariomycetidae sp. FL0641]